MAGISGYYDEDWIAQEVAAGRHRDVVGGDWDRIGKLQFDFLRATGLSEWSRLLDLGCGCLRAGVHLVRFLQPGYYFGLDISQELLRIGYEVELNSLGLCDRLPRENLICDPEFELPEFAIGFEFAIAQSLFTHLPANSIQLCLARTAPRMYPDGRLYASFLIVPDHHPIGAPFDHGNGVRSFDHRDPYHYRFRQVRQLCDGLPWSPQLIGDWGHPRGQQMVLFRPVAGEDGSDRATRALGVDEAAGLPAGARHYRAYVGPPDRYDFLSASQFALLFALGLREHHRVLDFGCGSLRLGRLLIPFLRAARYFGIDPNGWLIEDTLDRELGHDILERKHPHFSNNSDFNCEVFGTKFDFIVAQSILTHCGPDLAARLLGSIHAALAETGKAVFSVAKSTLSFEKPAVSGWVYPACVEYGGVEIARMCQAAGLHCIELPWYHPGAAWYIAARSPEDLPRSEDLSMLRGAVLFDPQFADSRRWPAV